MKNKTKKPETKIAEVTTLDPNQLLTEEEFAERRRVTPGTLANWRVQGTGPRFQRGKPVMYLMREVLKWEESITVSSTQE